MPRTTCNTIRPEYGESTVLIFDGILIHKYGEYVKRMAMTMVARTRYRMRIVHDVTAVENLMNNEQIQEPSEKQNFLIIDMLEKVLSVSKRS